MAYLITHFFEGGTEAQYKTTLDAVHGGSLPKGQTVHAAGPTEGGFLVVAIWDSKESCDDFIGNTLVPTLQSLDGGFAGPPQERSAQLVNFETA